MYPDLPVQIQAAYMFSSGGAVMVIDEQQPNTFYALDTANPTAGWTPYPLSNGPTTRIGSRFMSFGSILWSFGGMDDPTIYGPLGTIHNDMYGIDLQGIIMKSGVSASWVQVTADNVNGVPSPRIGYSWTGFGSHTVIMGGVTPPVGSTFLVCIQTPSQCQFHGSIWFYAPGNKGLPAAGSITGTSWQILSEAGAYGGPVPVPRFLHAAGSSGDQLFVYGGISQQGVLNDMWAYNLVSQTWAPITQTAPWPTNIQRGVGTMIGRAFFVYAWDGRGNSLWRWFPTASSGANTNPPSSNAPHPGTVAGLVIAALLGVANLAFVIILYRRSSGSQYIATPIPGDVYTAALG